MLTRIQIRADGDTAHNVESEMVDAMDVVAAALNLAAVMREQVIEGTPNEGFRGRLSFTLTKTELGASELVRAELFHEDRQPLDAVGPELSSQKGKVGL